jgi:anaerobic selenocysteine-containing dehydrogenase
MPSLKACVRGLAQKDVVYAPDRLTNPLKRVGQRGDGKFEPISWDEALETVTREFERLKEAYGNSAIFLMDDSGSTSPLQGMGKAGRRYSPFSEGAPPGGGSRPMRRRFFHLSPLSDPAS